MPCPSQSVIITLPAAQPDSAVSERCNSLLTQKPDYHTQQNTKIEVLCNYHPSYCPRSVPLQRGHLYPTVIPRTTIPMNCLHGKQPATSTCKMPPLQAGARRTILCFPKFQHQRAEQGKGLTSGKTQSDSPRTHSHKQTI